MTFKIWTDVNLITMATGHGPYGLIEDGAIVVSDGLIKWVGPKKKLPKYSKLTIVNTFFMVLY